MERDTILDEMTRCIVEGNKEQRQDSLHTNMQAASANNGIDTLPQLV